MIYSAQMGEADVETLRQGYAALNRGDLSVVLELLDAEIEWHEPATSLEGGTHRGRDSFERFLRGWLESFDGFRVEPERVVERGDDLWWSYTRPAWGGPADCPSRLDSHMCGPLRTARPSAGRRSRIRRRLWPMAASDPTRLARDALERVCSGSDPSAAVGVYSADFRDHVNARDYAGHDGIRRSLGLYQLVFSDGDLRIRVDDQDRGRPRRFALDRRGPQQRSSDPDLGDRDQPDRGRRDRRGLGCV